MRKPKYTSGNFNHQKAMNDEKKKKVLTTGVGLASGAASGTTVGIIHSHDEAPLEVTEVEVQQVTIPEESPVLEISENEVQQIVTPGEPVTPADVINEIQPVGNPEHEDVPEEPLIDHPDDPQEHDEPTEEIEVIDDMYGGPIPPDDNIPDLMYGGPVDDDDDYPIMMYGGPEDYDDDDPLVDDEEDDDQLLDDDDAELSDITQVDDI